jgi:hypothetical protein
VPEDKARITLERDQVAAVALASKESALAMQVEMQVDKAHITSERDKLEKLAACISDEQV